MNKEFLQNFQIGGQSLSDEAINAIMEENARDVSAATHPEDNGATSGKTFTQEDVNRIISERLAKEKSKAEPKEDEREKALKARETRMDCREYIASKKYPAELLDILDTNDTEQFKGVVEKLIKAFPGITHRKTPPPYAVGTGTNGMDFSNSIANAFKPPQI